MAVERRRMLQSVLGQLMADPKWQDNFQVAQDCWEQTHDHTPRHNC